MFIAWSETACATSKALQPLPPFTEPSISTTPTLPDTEEDCAQCSVTQSQANDHFRDMGTRHSLSTQEDETDCLPVMQPNVIGHTVKLYELLMIAQVIS